MDRKDTLMKSRYSDKAFQESFNDAKIDQININYENYIIEGTESTLMVLQKKNDTSTIEKSSSSNKFSKSFLNVKEDTKNSKDLFAKTTTNIPTQEDQNQKRKRVFQNLFLLHKYQEITQATTLQNIPQEVKTYKDKGHLALAKFSRFNLVDPDNKEIPCFLTERPINGPLSAYLEYISKFNLSTNSESDFDSSSKDINEFPVINEHFTTTPINLTKENKFLLIIGITAGIEFIHRLNKVHGQLNPTNIYLDENFLPKICGYGFIEPYGIDVKNDIDDNKNDDIDEEDDDEHDFGPMTNIAFIAPEVLNGKHIYQKSDVFSIGMIIYYILSGIEPFKNDRAQIQMKNICEGETPTFPECISDDWKKIILRCCELNPKTRYSSKELLSVLLKEETRDKLISSISDSDQEFEQASQSNGNSINIHRIKDNYIHSIINDFQFDEDFQDCYILREMVPDPTAIDTEAKEYILKASKDEPESLLIVGRYFLNSEHHFPKDEGNAFALIKKAATLGNPEAIKTLAEMYRKGIGSKKNLKKALNFYKDALKYCKDDKVEKSFIDKKIQEIEEELENPTPETNESTKHESIIIPQMIDKTAIRLRERDKENQEKCKIIICGIPNSATKADVESALKDYKDVAVTIKVQGLYDSANVSFHSKEDKDRFIKFYKKNKNKITVRKKNITEIIGIPKTAKDIEKERKKKRQLPIKKLPSKNKTHRKSDQDNNNASSYLINFDDYYPGPENEDYVLIGSGNFGIAYKAYRKEDDKLFVAKVFRNSFNNPSDRKNFVRETTALIEIDSPLIVRLVGYSMHSLINPSQKVATMIMEYVPGGTLEDVLKLENRKKAPSWWDDTAKLKTIIGIAKAMSFVHELNYIHRDLKPENIFFDENYEIKIGDFGCARKFDNNNEVIMTFNVGTPIYMAPEIFDSDNLRYKWEVDVYSFGIILYQILTKKTVKEIYPGIRNYYSFCEKILKNKTKPTIPKGLNPSLVDLMQRCWSHSIDDRPSFAFIFEVFKRTFDNESPTETFFPKVNVEEIRRYINKLASLDTKSTKDSDSD